MGEKLRGASHEAAAALARQGRYRTVADNLRVKQVRIDDGVARDRFVICHNPEEARRDAEIRAQIVDRLEEAIAGTDALPPRQRAELAGGLKTKPAFNRFLRTTPAGKLRIDRAAVRRDAPTTASTCCAPPTRASPRGRRRRLQGPLPGRARLA